MSFKKRIYGVYKKLQHYTTISSAASYVYIRLRKQPYMFSQIPALSSAGTQALTAALVCDEMTWQDFAPECQSFFVTPQNWKASFDKYSPSFFFCESAWSGIDLYRDSWRGRIYGSERIAYNNRRELYAILSYCKDKNIPTVFWNKEDPAFFGNKNYSFVDTALNFDIILTSSEECIPKYLELGAKYVYLWQFGFPALLFYPPPESNARENTAIFAGSWYGDQPQRCKDLEMLFDTVLANGIKLIIYNRYSGSANPIHQFPEKYGAFLKQAVPYCQLGDIYRKSSYVLNVNTVTNSETMFARRVFEAMACGCIIISNYSKGLTSVFGDKIWFIGKPFAHEQLQNIREANIKTVFASRTCKHRMDELLEIIKGYTP